MKNAVHSFTTAQTLVCSLAGVTSKKQWLETLAEALKLPQHFGRNWDAFADCLMDTDWANAPSYTLIFTHCEDVKKLSEDWETFKDILDETTAYWADEKKSFHVVLA